MKIKTSDFLFGTTLTFGILYLCSNKENQNLKKQNKFLAAQNYKLRLYIQELSTTIQTLFRNQEISAPLREKLNELIAQFQTIDENISAELLNTLKILNVGAYSIAVEKFVKILENIFKQQFNNDINYQRYIGHGYRNLNSYIEYAKLQRYLNEEEYLFVKALKGTRNREAHELNNEHHYGKNWFLGNLHLGINLICTLSRKFNLT